MSTQNDHVAHLTEIRAEMQSEHLCLLHDHSVDGLHRTADSVALSFQALEAMDRMIAAERGKELGSLGRLRRFIS